MNILVIGNGFDLAHGLPTKYTDFIKYCANYDINKPICDCSEMNEEFASFCEYNFWLIYFYSRIPDIDEIDAKTWIDFEKEIAEVIKKIEEWAVEINSSKEIIKLTSNSSEEIDTNLKLETDIFEEIFNKCNRFDNNENTFDNFVYSQLRKFARAFEIYCLMINKIEIDKSNIIHTQRKEEMGKTKLKIDSYNHQAYNASGYSGRQNEVERFGKLRDEESKKYCLLSSKISPADYLSLSMFNCVLSFNYTNTYERLYGSDKTEYCYIHGKAQVNRDKTNIILGIDDDLSSGKESKNFRWVRFKKYYQRIIFKTGSEYKDCLILSKQNQIRLLTMYILLDIR